MPSWEDFERYFQRVWLDHIPSWVQRALSPNENQSAYGREHARLVSIASLMLDRPELRTLPASAVFHEDAQTYYGKGCFGQTALWQMVTHHRPRAPFDAALLTSTATVGRA